MRRGDSGEGSKLGPVSCIHLETACLLNSTNFLLPFSCSPHLDEAHFWNSRAGTNQVHIPLLQRGKRMSGGFVKEERLFHLVRGKNERRWGSFVLSWGYLVNSIIQRCNFLVGFRYPEVVFFPSWKHMPQLFWSVSHTSTNTFWKEQWINPSCSSFTGISFLCVCLC